MPAGYARSRTTRAKSQFVSGTHFDVTKLWSNRETLKDKLCHFTETIKIGTGFERAPKIQNKVI